MSRFHITDFPRPTLPPGQHVARQLMRFTDEERSAAHHFLVRVTQEEGPTSLGHLMAALGMDLLATMYRLFDASVELADDLDRWEAGGDV
jgi:hypothetical protein